MNASWLSGEGFFTETLHMVEAQWTSPTLAFGNADASAEATSPSNLGAHVAFRGSETTRSRSA